MLYLKDNPLLHRPLRLEDFKQRIVGHWGTVPGINYVYSHLSAFVKRTKQRTLLIVGPGHAGPALLSNLYLEGTLEKMYPTYTQDLPLTALVRNFGIPGGFHTEISAQYPGALFLGGELGHAFSLAQGVAFDHPDLLIPVLIGDGEMETAPTAASWLSRKYLDRSGRSGTILPVLHLNGFRMGGRSILGEFTNQQLVDYFRGLGYDPHFVDTSHQRMQSTLEKMWNLFCKIRSSDSDDSLYPVLVLKTPKGWTAPEFIQSKRIAGGVDSHKAPIKKIETQEDIQLIESWLRSYKPEELFFIDGSLRDEVVSVFPQEDLKLGGILDSILVQRQRKSLSTVHSFQSPVGSKSSSAKVLANYLREVISSDPYHSFRVFCPDEMRSNRFDALLGSDRVCEILSEHVCQGWLEGYVLSGRNGILVSYEAFSSVVASMLGQYLKFLIESQEISWRRDISSLNLYLTSLGWRNCYSHQNPDLVGIMLMRKTPNIRLYFPADSNSSLVCMKEALESTNRVNIITATKYDTPVFMDIEKSKRAVRDGFSILYGSDEDNPDIILAAIGDWTVEECMAAARILEYVFDGDLSVRVVIVSELTALGSPKSFPHTPSDERFIEVFTESKPAQIVYNGYASQIEAILFERPFLQRFQVFGYMDIAGNYTRFSMMLKHGVNRFHIALNAVKQLKARQGGRLFDQRFLTLKNRIKQMYREYSLYLNNKGDDPPWVWDEDYYLMKLGDRCD